MKLIIMGLVAVALGTITAEAEARTGNELLKTCTVFKSDETYWQQDAACIAYIQGFIEGAVSFQTGWSDTKKKGICLPKGVTAGQMRDVVVKNLMARPEIRHESDMFNITVAAVAAFPCK